MKLRRDKTTTPVTVRIPPRLALLALLWLVAGCNTCLDTDSVKLEGGPLDASVDAGPADLSETDVTTPRDAGLGDVGDACVPQTAMELCQEQARSCGEAELVDRCGATRTVDCGTCDPQSSVCNTSGVCECIDGWTADDDRCVDVDECAEGLDDCADGTNCTNLPGEFQCSTCPTGFLDVNGDGTECVDVDECENGSAACDTLVSCTNTEGSYECGACPAGYDDVDGDGTNCDDVDECDLGTDDCSPNATCDNTPGSFDCTCDTGYTGDGVSCSDIDECANDPCDPNATCNNQPGSYECTCDDGFQGDGMTCDPIPLVNQVAQYKIDLPGGIAGQAVALNEDWDVDQTVPFASLSTDESEGDSVAVDLYLSAPDRLQVRRGDDEGAVTLVVSLVEFNSNAAKVQTGTYDFSSTMSEEVLTDPVAVDRTFAHHSLSISGSTADFDAMMVRMDLLGDRLVFERDDGRGVIEGHFWVVESTLGHFEVQQPRLTITAFGGCETESVTAVDPGRTFGLWSNDFAGTGGPMGAHVGCSLVNDSTVECCHGTGTAPATVTMFLVEFDPAIGGSTEGGLETLAGTTATVPLANVPGAASMALLGRPGNFGSVPGGTSFGDDAEGFVTVSLTPNDTLEISRGDGGGSAYARWQVVHWPD